MNLTRIIVFTTAAGVISIAPNLIAKISHASEQSQLENVLTKAELEEIGGKSNVIRFDDENFDEQFFLREYIKNEVGGEKTYVEFSHEKTLVRFSQGKTLWGGEYSLTLESRDNPILGKDTIICVAGSDINEDGRIDVINIGRDYYQAPYKEQWYGLYRGPGVVCPSDKRERKNPIKENEAGVIDFDNPDTDARYIPDDSPFILRAFETMDRIYTPTFTAMSENRDKKTPYTPTFSMYLPEIQTLLEIEPKKIIHSSNLNI